jgi:hypothetical protein
MITARILGSDDKRKQFLATDSGLIADTIRRFSHSKEAIRSARDTYQDPAIRAKLDEVLTALGG